MFRIVRCVGKDKFYRGLSLLRGEYKNPYVYIGGTYIIYVYIYIYIYNSKP